MRGQTERAPISKRQATEGKLNWDELDAGLFRRPAFRGISGRDMRCSSEAMNSSLPRGRPEECGDRRNAPRLFSPDRTMRGKCGDGTIGQCEANAGTAM